MKRTYDPACGYSQDTQVLTHRGWFSFNHVADSDEVATRTLAGQFEWQKPISVQCFRHDGELVEFKNRYVDLRVTPGQPLFTRHTARHLNKRTADADRAWRFEPARHFAYVADPHWEIPATASWQGSGPSEFFLPNTEGSRRPDLHMPIREFCGLAGLYLSEGYVSDRHVRGTTSHHIKIEIAQVVANPRFPDVEAALRATGLTWHYRNNNFYTTFARLGRWLKENCGHHSHNKHIPAWMKDLPSDCLQALVYTMMLGDGTWGPLGQHYYPTCSERLADDVHEIFLKLGLDAAIHLELLGQVARGERLRPLYKVNEILQGDGAHRLPPAVRREHHGNIGSIRVPNPLILVRREGRTAWCGADPAD